MATNYKILGQVAPSPSTSSETTLYTVPSLTQSVLSTITICNRSIDNRVFRIAVKPTTGTALANQHYIAFDGLVEAKDTVCLTLGIALGAGNTISVFQSDGGTNALTFNAFGSEITA